MKMILPTYYEITKVSVSFINELECSPEYVTHMLRDVAEAIISSHPELNKSCSCCKFFWIIKFEYYLKF